MDTFLQSVKNYDYIRLMFADMYGINRGKILHTSHANHAINGCSLYSGSVAMGPKGHLFVPKEVFGKYANGLVKADVSTLRLLPWAGNDKHRVAGVLGETTWGDGRPQVACPRYVARQQLKRLEELGLKLMSSFEVEVTILGEDGLPVFKANDYLDMNVTFGLEPFFMALDSQMRKAGIEIEGLHAEFSPGQIEAIMEPSWGIQTADSMFLLCSGMKEIAKEFGFSVSSMCDVPEGAGSTGQHFNFSVWDINTNNNKFCDANGEDKLSDFAHHWIAGLVEHASALTALTCPTVNCYRRLHNFIIPDDADWDIDNRTVSFRVKNQSPSATYIENRIPSSMCNPYIVLAATIAAGLDGVERKLECPPKKDLGAKKLPMTLKEALTELEEDIPLRNALGEDFVEWFLGTKRSVDLKHLDDYKKDAEDDEERKKKEMDFYFLSM